VLVAQSVSVTWEVTHGSLCWRLTRESGTVPRCDAGRGCVLYDRERPRFVARNAYIVFKVCTWNGYGQYGVVIGALNAYNTDVVSGRIIPMVRAAMYDASGGVLARILNELGNGMFSGSKDCGCNKGSKAMVCAECRGQVRRFVSMGCFSGLQPCGKNHWFSGVTDAVGHVDHLAGDWLRCFCSR
jgi:hypothetical protein